MSRRYFTHHWINAFLRKLLIKKSTNHPFHFYLGICFLFILNACAASTQTYNPPIGVATLAQDEDAILPTSFLEATIEVNTLTSAQVTNTPLFSLEPIVTPSQTPSSIVIHEVITPVTTPTTQLEAQPLTGRLFISGLMGIQQVILKDSTSEYLISAQNDWLSWGANFAENKKYVVYTIRRVNEIEVWFTSLLQWQPERILVLEGDVEGGAGWAANDRYILFQVFVRDTSGPVEEIKITKTYVIDRETMEFVTEPYWPGVCSILAASPKTGQLSLWCKQTELEGDVEKFLVLEPDEAPWFTQETPEPLIDNCLIMAVCAWSQDGKFVAYIVQTDRPDSLFYTPVDNINPVRLDDERSNYYAWPIWSPDSQFLYYDGACVGSDLECPNVISVATQDVIWRAKDNNNHGEMGNISVASAAWAPNSRFIAIPVIDGQDGIKNSVILFDAFAQQEVGRWPGTDDIILDMVWVDN